MGSGIHVEIAVSGIERCPAALISTDFEVESVTTDGRSTGGDDGRIGELTIRDSGSSPGYDRAERILADEERAVYRFREETGECPCGKLSDHGCPAREIRADSGTLTLSFLALDLQTVRSVVEDLRACSRNVRVQRLTHAFPDGDDAFSSIDRAAFTDRQYEVLRTSHERGYFDHPKQTTATDVADALDISVATLSEHLAVAQEKLLNQLLTEPQAQRT